MSGDLGSLFLRRCGALPARCCGSGNGDEFFFFSRLRFHVEETTPLREGEPVLAGRNTPYDVAGVHDFIEFPVLVHVFIEFVHCAFLKFAIARGLCEVEGRWRWLHLLVVFLLRSTSDILPCYLYSDSPLSSRPQPMGSGGDATPCEDTREDFGLSFFTSSTTCCCRVFFLLSVAGTLWPNEGVLGGLVTDMLTPLRRCSVGRCTAGSAGSRAPSCQDPLA